MIHKLIYRYFSRRMLSHWCIFLLDGCIVYLSQLLVYTFNTGVSATLQALCPLLFTLLVYWLFFCAGFKLFHTYSGILRYSSFVDLQRSGWAMLFGVGLSFVFKYTAGIHPPFVPVRTRDLLLGTLISMLLIWGIRVLVKLLFDSISRPSGTVKIFIFDIRGGGISIAKSVRSQHPARYELAGFTTADTNGPGKVLMGVKVHPFDSALPGTMSRLGAKALFVSPLSAETLRESQDLVDTLVSSGIRIFTMPSEQKWDGHTNIEHTLMHEVNIEDLLPREQIEVDLPSIGTQLSGRRILVTGAAGSIGSEIVRQVASFSPAELLLVDQAETPLHDIRLMMAKDYPKVKAYTVVADISNRQRMSDLFATHRPEYVFHAAAYKHVPMMEDNPAESVQNNVLGTKTIADLAVKCGTRKFVMVSTDKAVNPTNVMGCSKRICEIYVQSLDNAVKEGKVKGCTRFVTTRFGNVLGSNGSVIPLFKEQIRRGGPVTVTHPDIIRYFMLIPEACKLVLEAGTMGHGGEIFVFDMGHPVKIVDLARRMINLSGVSGVEIEFTGLRDGEKLYEEVLSDEETTLPTFHPKIKIARVRSYAYEDAVREIEGLIEVSRTSDDMSIVRRMKAIVPEFKSQHSKYEALDAAGRKEVAR